MLSRLVKEHHAKQSARRELQEIKRKEAIAAANDLTQALVEHLNLGVAQAYLNQKKIEEEVKQLHFNMSQFSKQTHQWVTLIEGFNGALKQIGDLENWSRIIESDMKCIAETLEHTYNGIVGLLNIHINLGDTHVTNSKIFTLLQYFLRIVVDMQEG